ncbi:MAG: hypothetical protein WAK29_19005 [Terriglobales bacterium]
MSAGSHSLTRLPQDPDVLGDLLHSLSQPLTGLRCSLELSLEEVAEQQQETVVVALQQTEQVIGMIQLMRQYLEAEKPSPCTLPVELMPVIQGVMEELSSIAFLRDIELNLQGTCKATLSVSEAHIRLALQYLLTTVIDAQPAGSRLSVVLADSPSGAILRVKYDAGLLTQRVMLRTKSTTPSTLLRVKVAIASRILENAGAFLSLTEDDCIPSGFVLRVPRQVG